MKVNRTAAYFEYEDGRRENDFSSIHSFYGEFPNGEAYVGMYDYNSVQFILMPCKVEHDLFMFFYDFSDDCTIEEAEAEITRDIKQGQFQIKSVYTKYEALRNIGG